MTRFALVAVLMLSGCAPPAPQKTTANAERYTITLYSRDGIVLAQADVGESARGGVLVATDKNTHMTASLGANAFLDLLNGYAANARPRATTRPEPPPHTPRVDGGVGRGVTQWGPI